MSRQKTTRIDLSQEEIAGYKAEIRALYSAIDKDQTFKSLLDSVLTLDFCNHTASCSHHHYGDGQLLAHTNEVISYAIGIAAKSKKINLRDLFFACLFHDVGKLKDYKKENGQWFNLDHKYKIHHVQASSQKWIEEANKVDYPAENILEVQHAILAHHGRPEWGSPIEPQTRLAWALHLADMTSAMLY